MADKNICIIFVYIKSNTMKTLILTSVLALTTLSVFSQRTYDFDKPWRAKSNEGVYEWYIEHLDDTCDSLVNELFSSIGVNTDSIQWEYPTDLTEVLYEKGMNYYSTKIYIVNDRDKKIKFIQKYVSENKLPHRLFDLNCFYKDGITTLILVEHY